MKKNSTGTTGAIGEILVSAYLLEMGLSVFRALSPACPFDLAVLSEVGLIGVEVRTGTKIDSGRVTFQTSHQGADVFAVRVNGQYEVLFFAISRRGNQFLSAHGLKDNSSESIHAGRTHDVYGIPIPHKYRSF